MVVVVQLGVKSVRPRRPQSRFQSHEGRLRDSKAGRGEFRTVEKIEAEDECGGRKCGASHGKESSGRCLAQGIWSGTSRDVVDVMLGCYGHSGASFKGVNANGRICNDVKSVSREERFSVEWGQTSGPDREWCTAS